MNINRPHFARAKIGAETIDLGHTNLKEIVVRFIQQIQLARGGGDYLIQLEISTKEFTNAAGFDRASELEFESSQLIADPAEEIYPGLTAERISECVASQEYFDYEPLCDPERRMGMSLEYINDVKQRYFEAWPDCAPHFPLWRTRTRG